MQKKYVLGFAVMSLALAASAVVFGQFGQTAPSIEIIGSSVRIGQ